MAMREDFAQLKAYEQRMEKIALDPVTLLEAYGASYPISYGLRRLGLHQAPSFMHTGLELGQQGKKMGHNASGITRTFLGGDSYKPYENGLALGNDIRAQGLTKPQSHDFLNEWIQHYHQQEALRKEEMFDLGRGKKYIPDKTPHLVERVMNGEGDNHLSRFLISHGIQAEEPKKLVHHALQGGYTALVAPFDKRVIMRPLLQRYKDTPTVGKFESFMQKTPMTRGIRKYID